MIQDRYIMLSYGIQACKMTVHCWQVHAANASVMHLRWTLLQLHAALYSTPRALCMAASLSVLGSLGKD